MQKEEIEIFCPANQKAWRKWLEKNHDKKDAVWLVIYKKGSATPNLSWSEAVDEALCFGWIDSVRKSLDDEKFIQYVGKRKAVSIWSKINKEKVALLIEQGLMKTAGLKSIETAKQNGSWSSLDEVEALVIPDELKLEFKRYPGSKEYFSGLSKSGKKILLHWIAFAKRPETKQKRIAEIAENAGRKMKPKQFW